MFLFPYFPYISIQFLLLHVLLLLLMNVTCFRYVMMGGAQSGGLSTESYVYNLLYEVMVPLPGRSTRIACFPPTLPSLGSDPALIIQRPSSIEELPLFDFPLRQVFSLLGANTVVQLFTCVLLENQVMLSSSGMTFGFGCNYHQNQGGNELTYMS